MDLVNEDPDDMICCHCVPKGITVYCNNNQESDSLHKNTGIFEC